MTVDTVAKIVDGEKYLSRKSVGGGGGGGDGGVNGGGNGHVVECNGEGKDDYVFVNGSDADAGSSDDHSENHDDVEKEGEVLVGGSSVEKGDRLCNAVEVDSGESNGVDTQEECEVDGGELRVENGLNVKREKEGGFEGERLAKEKGETKLKNEVASIEEEKPGLLNGDGYVEVVGEVLPDEGYSNGVRVVDAVASPSVDDHDKLSMNSVVDREVCVPQVCEVETRDGAGVVEAEPQILDGELARQKDFMQQGGEKQGSEPESCEGDVQELEVHEDNGDLHEGEVQVPEPEPVASDVTEQNPLETKVNQSREDGLSELQQSDVEVKTLTDSKSCESLLPGAEGDRLSPEYPISANQSSDFQMHDSQPTDLENMESDSIEAEAKIKEQGDVNPLVYGGSQDLEPGNSVAFGHELDNGDGVVVKDNIGLLLTAEAVESPDSNTLPIQSETVAPTGMVEEADIPSIDGQSIEFKIETPVVEETAGNLVIAMQSKPTVEQGRVAGDRKSEREVEVGGSPETCANDDVLPDHVPEQTASADTLVREVSLNDLSCPQATLEDHITVEKDYGMVVEEDKNAVGVDTEDSISENEVTGCPEHDSRTVSESVESSDVARSSLSFPPEGSMAELPSPFDVEKTNEPRAAVGTSGFDNDLGESFPSKSNVSLNNALATTGLRFGTFESPSTSHNQICQPKHAMNDSAEPISWSNVAAESSYLKSNPEDGIKSSNLQANGSGLNHHNTGGGEAVSLVGVNKVSGSSVEEPEPDTCDGQVVNPDLIRTFSPYVIRIPRCDDEILRDTIKKCQDLVDEKTKIRDAIGSEIRKKKAIFRELQSAWDAAKSEERAASGLVKSKRKALESAYSVVNLARDMTTVDDINIQIRNMDRRIQHETLDLREEKKLIREIKQLKDHREQLSSNTKRQQEEVQQALSQRAQNEENLKALRKELDAIRGKHSEAFNHVNAVETLLENEDKSLESLKKQYDAANLARQDAYAQLQNLKKQLHDKNKPFYNYKQNVNEAQVLAKTGDKDGFERYCVNQVEKIMDLWNKDEKFRKDYIRCNEWRTLRRLGTLDGRALGIDEVQSSVPNVPVDRIDALVKVKPDKTVLTLQRESPVEVKSTVNKISNRVLGHKNEAVPAKKKEATPKSSVAEASGQIDAEENEESKRTKEEEELARKEEQTRKENVAARLKEQRRLEEKMKAQEALERKQKRAEEAKVRAEFRAQKEAEEKEKKREKRAKKKEKKRGISSEVAEAETSQPPEPMSEPVRVPEVTEKPVTTSRKVQKTKRDKALTPIPVALKHRRKSWAQRHWRLLVCILLLVVAAAAAMLFLLNH